MAGKGAGDTADGLMGGSGLQYLVASNMHLLSDATYRGFEVPLLHELDSYKEKNAENEDRYKKQASEKSRDLRQRETQHLKLARQKKRSQLLLPHTPHLSHTSHTHISRAHTHIHIHISHVYIQTAHIPPHRVLI